MVQKLNKRFRSRSSAIKNKNGILLTEGQEIKNRHLQYMKDLCEKVESREQQHNGKDKNIEEPEPLLEEVYRAIKRISNNRVAGNDEIPIELVKKWREIHGENYTQTMLSNMEHRKMGKRLVQSSIYSNT